jgi:MFS family permease
MPGLSLSHFNTLLKVCPADRRATFIALYSTMMNAGAFVSPLIGVAIASRVGIPTALIFGGCLWLVGGALFTLLPVRPSPSVRAGAQPEPSSISSTKST